MRKYFFSAMALVLGLFTVTAVFAFLGTEHHVKREGEVVYYMHEEEDVEDGWDNPENWTDEPENDQCPTPTETVCRINLEENQELDDFLKDIDTFDDLLEHDQVDLRESP